MKIYAPSFILNNKVKGFFRVPCVISPEDESKLLNQILLEGKDVTIGEQILPVMEEELGKKYFNQKMVILEKMSIKRYVSIYPEMVLCAFFRQIIFYYLTDSKKFSYLKENFNTFDGVNLLIKRLTERVKRDFFVEDKVDLYCNVVG